MIRASFSTSGERFTGFKIGGHSGFADPGSDIVCAAVSAMTGLVIHTAVDIYNDGGTVKADEKNAVIEFRARSEKTYDLIKGLYGQLEALAEEYPENVSVKRLSKD